MERVRIVSCTCRGVSVAREPMNFSPVSCQAVHCSGKSFGSPAAINHQSVMPVRDDFFRRGVNSGTAIQHDLELRQSYFHIREVLEAGVVGFSECPTLFRKLVQRLENLASLSLFAFSSTFTSSRCLSTTCKGSSSFALRSVVLSGF